MEALARKQEAERPGPAVNADAAPSAPTSAPTTVTAVAPPPEPTHRGTRIAAFAVAGASAVALGVGTYFGVRAIQNDHAADKLCPGNMCSEDGKAKNNDAVIDARICDVALGIGFVAAGVATYLFVTSSGEAAPATTTARARLQPVIGPRSGGLLAELRW